MTADRPNEFGTSDHRRAELEAAERKAAGVIDPGVRALVVAVAVLILLGSFALPHAGSANGWEVLTFSQDAAAEEIALPSRLFVWFALVFGGLGSIIALVTGKWAAAWIALAGSAVSIIFGMLSIWSRQTLPAESTAGGPGIGLVLGWFAIIVIVFHWCRVVWARTSAQLEAEARLREEVAKDETPRLRRKD
ncbi:hypothetical protein OED52_08880 [Rhodococcus sp. Z13]|uniref:Uncharacterized protein n=2 Tax=Rhodococcus sacchari TaxID=2962047 RepID=A0ACD4DKN8_9NOCA|nr:hypothetical protein [Rhodococcus sp. Z13]UYP20612.1 hypothetical protein OED52_08880 [Rhodococcus sp. Z13]